MTYGDYISSLQLPPLITPLIVAKIILRESSGNPFAYRYEEEFFEQYLRGKSKEQLAGYVPPLKLVSLDSELHGRAASWGDMQTLGDTARCMGFEGLFFTELCDPKQSILYGVRYLNHLVRILGGKGGATLSRVLLKYNGGRDLKYPEKVLRIEDLQAEELLRRGIGFAFAA